MARAGPLFGAGILGINNITHSRNRLHDWETSEVGAPFLLFAGVQLYFRPESYLGTNLAELARLPRMWRPGLSARWHSHTGEHARTYG